MARQPHHGMTIAFVCFSRSWGGLELMLAKLARALQARGHRVIVISPGGSPLHQDAARNGITAESLTPRFPYLDIATASRLSALFRRHGVQVCIIGRSRDISTVALTHGSRPRVALAYFQQMQFGLNKKDLFHRLVYSRLGSWITLTHAMRRSALAHTTVPEERITVIPFGADTKVFDPKRFQKGRSRRMFGIPARAKVAAVIGRLDPQKGQREFLMAIPAVLRTVRGAQFLVVGEETRGEEGQKKELEALARSLSITNSVRFLPFTEHMPDLLSAIDILAMPSSNETFGYLAVEALAMKVPVIGTRAGGLPEIVEHERAGLLIEPGDVEALAAAMIRLFRDPKLHRSLSLAGRLRARKEFDFNLRVDQLEDVLRGIV